MYEIAKFATPNRIGWTVKVPGTKLLSAVARRIEQLQRTVQLDQSAIEVSESKKAQALREHQEYAEETLAAMIAFRRLFLLAPADAVFEVTADDAQFFQLP